MNSRLQTAIALLVCAALVTGCAAIPWSGKRESSALEKVGTIEALSLSAESPVAFLRQGDVWLAPAAGGEPVRVTTSGGAWYPQVSPGGAAVAFVMAPAAEGEGAGLWAVALDTGDARLLATGDPPWGVPAWSPDGERLAWPSRDNLMVLNVTSGEALQTHITELASMSRFEPVWSGDGARLYYPRGQEGSLAMWVFPATGEPYALESLDPTLPWAAAPAPEGGLTLWQAGKVRLLDAAAPGEPMPVPEAVGAPVGLSWSPDGDQLALVDSKGALWVASSGDWPDKPEFSAAGLSGVRWESEDALLLERSDPTPRDQTLVRVSLPDGAIAPLSSVPATYTGPVSAAYAELPAASSAVSAQAAARAYDYYRYQGEWDSGAMASSNCGPTSVAMAIQFARNNLWVPISDIRTYIGGSSWTYASSLRSALNHWGVTNRTLSSLAEMDAALARGSIVLAHVWMYYITPGTDYMVAGSSPAGNTNRFYRYDQSHWLVLKGISADGQWVITHDPNVWDGNGVYWYSGNLAKGRDRLYRYSELAAAITAYNLEFLEVPDGGAAPAPTAVPAVTVAPTTGVPTGGVWHTVRSGENLYRISLHYGTTVAAIAAANGLADPNRIYIGQQLWIPLAGGVTPVATTAPPTATPSLVPPTATTAPPTATSSLVPPTPTLAPPTATTAPLTATPSLVSPTLTPTPLPGSGVYHTVTWGDTLGGIATRYGVAVQAIMQANRLTNPNLIRIGQRLWIPLGGAGATPTPTRVPSATPTSGAERWYTVQRGDTLTIIAGQYGTTWQAIAEANGLNAWSVIYAGQRLRIP
jgi:LysM repeat protein